MSSEIRKATMNQMKDFLTKGYLLILIPFLMICFTQCEKDDELVPEENSTISWDGDLNIYLNSLNDISDEMPVEADETEMNVEESEDDDYYYTKTDYYAAAGFNEQMVLNPTYDVIYPGALVKGESILDGTYTLIPAIRNPITISTSLTGSDIVSIEIEDPKLSTTREAINKLMTQEYDVPPAHISFDIHQAYSEEQLALNLQASYKGKKLNINGGFSYNSSEQKTRLVAKFIQSYYTLDMDMPQKPSDLFAEEIDSTFFGTYAPMYISTVTFGRLALFTIESTLSEDSVRAYLNGSYKKISASASLEFDRLVATSDMKVYILGGSGEDASSVIDGFEAFKSFIKNGGNYSKSSPGAPISYKLRNIKDNSIAMLVYAANYSIVSKIPKEFEYNITIAGKKIKHTGVFDDKNKLTCTEYPNQQELSGSIKAEVKGMANEVELWQYYGGYWGVTYDDWKELDQDAISYNNTNPCIRRIADFEGISINDSIKFSYIMDDYDWCSPNEKIEDHEECIAVSDIISIINDGHSVIVEKEKIHVEFQVAYEKVEIQH